MAEYVVAEDEAMATTEDMYECSTCQMYFHSVMDHIKKYHNKQNVVIDMNEEQLSEVQMHEPEMEKIEELEEEIIENLIEKVEEVPDEEQTEQIMTQDESPVEEDPGNMYYLEYVSEAEAQIVKLEQARSLTPLEVETDGVMDEIVEEIEDPISPMKSRMWEKRTSSRKTVTSAEEIPTNANQCGECGTFFANNKSLRLHMKMHKPVNPKTLKQSIQNDMRGVKDEEPDVATKTFHCDQCNKDLDETFIDIHMKMHSNEPTFHCHICNKKFESEENLQMHGKSHQERTNYVKECRKKDTPRPYNCQYCDKSFIRPHEKVKHERIHTGEKPHKCEVCGKSFRVAYCLTLHMRTHTKVRPYVCSICGQRFKAQSVYNHHLKTHSEERNYQCPYCPKTFKTSVQLSGHKNSHTKPFVCTECNRPFASLFSVKAHMEMHKKPNNGLRYKCDLCGATYARNSSVKDHIKKTHNRVSDGDLYSEIDPTSDITSAVEKVTPNTLMEGELDDDVVVDEVEWIS
ncbi:zinc finger protein 271 [Sergentomyia squamirostris]